MKLVREKALQASEIVSRSDVDLWLLFVRDTTMHTDPVLPLLVEGDLAWDSFLAFHADGRRIALVGNLDVAILTRDEQFTEVRPYVTGVGQSIKQLLEELQPRSIALNYSTDDAAADGITHGLYLKLTEFLRATPFAERLVSGAHLCGELRNCKTPAEVSRVAEAARIADAIWHESAKEIAPGMTEIQIAGLLDSRIAAAGYANSFDTIVNAGDKTSPGHGFPTDAVLSPGDLLHVDYGVRYEGYCSDIQRLLYVRRPGEQKAPDELRDAFAAVTGIISSTAREAAPGREGWQVDEVARTMLRDNGYSEYQHALGHQLGRAVHDGGAILGPRWERYGSTPTTPLQENNLFTLELEIILPGIGCVGLEEDVCIRRDGAEFLAPRQTEILLL